MPDQPPRKSILEQATAAVEHSIEPLADDEKAAISVTSDQDTLVKAGGAVDLGKGFQAGGEVEKKRSAGWEWFAGLTKRWKK